MKYINDKAFIDAHASVRAKHTIEQIGGVAILITEFNRVGSFDHIPGVGPQTNKELQKLTKRIINLNIPVIEIPYQEPPKHKSLSQIYDYLFQYLSIRAQHILSNIETLYIGPDSSRNIKLLINDYIYHKIDLRKFRNLGAKTEEEIKIFVKNVMNVHLNGEQNNLMFGDKRKEVAFVRKSYYPGIGPIERSTIKLENNKYNFLSAVAYYLLSNKKGKTFKKVVREYYFSPQTPNKSQVAEMVGCSKERVRQVIFETESKIVNQIVDSIYANHVGELTIKFTNTKKDVIIVHPEKYKNIKIFDLPSVNSSFINLVAEHYFKKNGYISLNAIINSEREKYNLFDSNKSLVYCRIKGINKIIWRKLLTNIHNRISINLNSGIQYKFNALVIDEFKRSKISIPIKILNTFLKALNQLNRNLTNTVAEAKFNRLSLQNKIVGYAQQFIETKGKGVSIDLIISYLEKKNIVLTKSQLIHILNYNNDLIVYNSLKGWVLKEWPEAKNEAKNIQDLAIKCLKDSKVPVHISVLLDRIGEYKKVSKESLYANLHLYRSKEIVHFNCWFLGLSNKKYDLKWSKLPRIHRGMFKELKNVNLTKHQLNKIATEIEQRYSVPKIHTLFVYNS